MRTKTFLAVAYSKGNLSIHQPYNPSIWLCVCFSVCLRFASMYSEPLL